MYELIKNIGPLGGEVIKRDNEDGTVSWIPIDESNSDYQLYLKWLEGNNVQN